MTQHLYVVRVERIHEVVVIARNESDAEEAAEEAVASDDGGLGEEQRITDARPLKHDGRLPPGWDQDCFPYGEDDRGQRRICAIWSVMGDAKEGG